MTFFMDCHRAATAAKVSTEEVAYRTDRTFLHAGRTAPAIADLADLRLPARRSILQKNEIAGAGFRAAAAADAAVLMDAYAHNDLL